MRRRRFLALGTVFLGLTILPLTLLQTGATAPKAKKRVLVVTVTKGFRHDSIPAAEETIQQLGNAGGGWSTDFARTDADLQTKMTASALKNYDAVIFANTTGVLPLPEPRALLDFVRSGKGFAAMHSGSDTFHQYPGDAPGEVSSYVRMLGGEFLTHHAQSQISGLITDPKAPANVPLVRSQLLKIMRPQEQKNDARLGLWVRKDRLNAFDEIYLLKNVDRASLHTLIKLDAYPNDGSPEANRPGEHLVSWVRSYGKGRVFYTLLGHRKEMWADPLYRAHLVGGIQFVLGLKKGDTTPN